jgi:hypothetical protein
MEWTLRWPRCRGPGGELARLEGVEAWAAYEGGGGLALACEHDGLGHITLTVELQEGAGYGWLVRGDVPLEAGRLDVVARELRRLETG